MNKKNKFRYKKRHLNKKIKKDNNSKELHIIFVALNASLLINIIIKLVFVLYLDLKEE